MNEITTKTPEQIDAAFAKVFKDLKPKKQALLTPAQRLEPYRKAVLALRQEGCSWKVIAKGMADPDIGERTSPTTLKKIFGTRSEKHELRVRREKAKAKVEPVAMQPAPIPSA